MAKSQLYRRKGSPFWQYDFTDLQTGTRVRGSTKQKARYLAQAILDEKKQKARQTGIDSVRHKAPTVTVFSTEFLKWVEDCQLLQPTTRKFYRHGWDLLRVTNLANMKLDEIKNVDCQMTTFPAGPYHANQALRTLRRMLSLAKEMKVLFGELPRVKMREEASRRQALTVEQANAIAARMPDGNAKDVFLVLRGTGMRPREVFGMRWEYANLEEGVYHIPKGKTKNSARNVPLFHDSLSVLRRRQLEQGRPIEGWVFPNPESASGHLQTIQKTFTRARDAAGLPKIFCVYTARHGHLTDLAKVAPLSEVMQMGGHGDITTAHRYQHVQTPNLQEKLDEMLKTGRIQ